jgi:hypothetical protein
MTEFAAVEFVLILFVLRFGIPLALVLFFGWVVNRVQSRWNVG